MKDSDQFKIIKIWKTYDFWIMKVNFRNQIITWSIAGQWRTYDEAMEIAHDECKMWIENKITKLVGPENVYML